MRYSLGMDVGSVNAKLVLVDETGAILHADTEKIGSGPQAALNAVIARLGERFDFNQIQAAGVSGSGKGVIPEAFDWGKYSSSLAIASGVLHRHGDARTIIQIGGQSSLVIELEDGLKKPWKVASNPLCAAGTGRFLEQQAYRLGISMADFAELALRCAGPPPRIAARCSVFAKSDLIHLQQKGASVEAMLYALCESIARMVAALQRGAFQEPIYFIGGVAANRAIVKALNEIISARNGHAVDVIVPDDPLHAEALGAALLSAGKRSRVGLLPHRDAGWRYLQMPGLEPAISRNGRDVGRIDAPCVGFLGVDVGSTSTKAVILAESGSTVLAKSYLMTAGRPIDAVKDVFRCLLRDGVEMVRIAGVGVTGSGRYLVGSFIGADLIKNEITAQARAGAEIDPQADIIEIGGQDSKLVIKRNGVVIDYQMNKACAAGTGSFIDELAEMLDVPVKNGEFAELAFAAPHTIDLGTRCAAFMGQAVASAQQEGVSLDVITASLANSIAKNYLSKVVGTRKLGSKIILTGAVFYNQAVVSAFRAQLPDKTLIVPEHKEVSGAIGAALLAREELSGRASRFKGFQAVVEEACQLSTFTCKGCENNCTITRMQVAGEKSTFYGSRCDRYDSIRGQGRVETAFDERERLLFREQDAGAGRGPAVAIPRALLVYDYAPLLIGFLNALGAKVVLSEKTTKETIEKAIELSYTDSCFPLKLLHGHAATIHAAGIHAAGMHVGDMHVVGIHVAEYILYPSAIRMGEKDGDENQKYTCPLIQASPYIIRQALDLGDKLLIPTLDFSHGPGDTIRSLAEVATRMGFSRRAGQRAARAGLASQERFEADRAVQGEKLLKQLHAGNGLGVVLLARAYMAQDAGANLGIAEKLAQLGVAPVPLDYLPLDSVAAKTYSDRPYWLYESKLIAAADIIARDPQLYGLVLTNFGCGPNSFIVRIIEDIMADKPLGQLEIDEHAAEAGIVTRLEAFVDTIKGFASPAAGQAAPREQVYRGASAVINAQKTLLLPRMAPHVWAVAAAMEASGARAVVLPEPDERNLIYSNQVTSGVECLPFRVSLGDFIRAARENGADLTNAEAFMAGSYGPCRLGKYAVEQMHILRKLGIDLPIRSSVSNTAYRDLNLGPGFERLAWQGIVAIDVLQKLLWRTRPYEKTPGAADVLFETYTARIAAQIRENGSCAGLLRQATAEFKSLIDPRQPRRPLVGINGEIYLRANRFSNNNLVKACEDAGLEVVVAALGEWFKYTAYRNVEDAIRDRRLKKMVVGYIKQRVQEHDARAIAQQCTGLLEGEEPSTAEILSLSGQWLSSRCGSEAVLSIGSGIEWLKDPQIAGVISVMPHGCMPGGIVAAMSEKFSKTYQKPWINLTYDGFPESNNLARINDFAELVRFCSASAPATE